MLLEEGFELVSADASDKMLKTAYKTRWDRRREPAFDRWVIEEANWLRLDEVVSAPEPGGFDAIVCMGNSFAHLPDFEGDGRDQRAAVDNFRRLLRPGGVLVIDHRNYDAILRDGRAPVSNAYYNGRHVVDIRTSVLHVNGRASLVTLDYRLDLGGAGDKGDDETAG